MGRGTIDTDMTGAFRFFQHAGANAGAPSNIPDMNFFVSKDIIRTQEISTDGHISRTMEICVSYHRTMNLTFKHPPYHVRFSANLSVCSSSASTRQDFQKPAQDSLCPQGKLTW